MAQLVKCLKPQDTLEPYNPVAVPNFADYIHALTARTSRLIERAKRRYLYFKKMDRTNDTAQTYFLITNSPNKNFVSRVKSTLPSKLPIEAI